MNPKSNYQTLLAISISLALMACNQNGKKAGEAEATDSTATTKTETVPPPAQSTMIDAVSVDPTFYSVGADTLGIRAMVATYKPGDSSAMHSHPDNAIYVIAGGRTEFTTKDGEKRVVDLKMGMTSIAPEGFHRVKNISKTTNKVLVVEVNRPREIIAPNTAMDATKVAPDLYKLKNDSLGIRVIEVTYKPGQSSAMHSHPDNAVYVISGGTIEFTEKDGTKHTVEFKPGMIMVRPGGEHSVKNTGKTTLKVLLVEVNRPIK